VVHLKACVDASEQNRIQHMWRCAPWNDRAPASLLALVKSIANIKRAARKPSACSALDTASTESYSGLPCRRRSACVPWPGRALASSLDNARESSLSLRSTAFDDAHPMRGLAQLPQAQASAPAPLTCCRCCASARLTHVFCDPWGVQPAPLLHCGAGSSLACRCTASSGIARSDEPWTYATAAVLLLLCNCFSAAQASCRASFCSIFAAKRHCTHRTHPRLSTIASINSTICNGHTNTVVQRGGQRAVSCRRSKLQTRLEVAPACHV
jgi:hypothetical protein